MIRFYGEELLASRSSPKLEDRPLLAVFDCFFNVFAATLHIGGCSSICNLRMPMPWWRGPTYYGLSYTFDYICGTTLIVH